MSVYATFFTIDDDDDHTRDCARHAVAPTPEREVYWYEGGDKTGYDPDAGCTCEAMGGPYVYEASHKSITGPDHERAGSVTCCRAVGTWTMRLWVDDGEPAGAKRHGSVVLLDKRQVEAMRDALTEFLDFWDDPEDYGRSEAFDAAPADSPERLAMRADRDERMQALLANLIAERAEL